MLYCMMTGMNEKNLVKILAELGHETRLSIFRLVIKYGDSGISVGEVGRQLEIAPSTLNFHLSRLVEAQIIKQNKQGRSIYCVAAVDVLNSAMDLLTAECCSEAACGCN